MQPRKPRRARIAVLAEAISLIQPSDSGALSYF
jgi:hypothetical protein